MLRSMERASAPSSEETELLELPALDGADEHEGLDDPDDGELRLPAAGDPQADDTGSTELPLELRLDVGSPSEPSALGDDANGIGDTAPSVGLDIDERAPSLLDLAGPDLGSADEEAESGLEPLPADTERSDAEGLEDPAGERLDAGELPELDVGGDEDEIEVGIELGPLPPDGSEPSGNDEPTDD
jgi:hypothetical protein